MINQLQEVKTLHGLIDQIVRTLRKGEIDLKGRYKAQAREGANP